MPSEATPTRIPTPRPTRLPRSTTRIPTPRRTPRKQPPQTPNKPRSQTSHPPKTPLLSTRTSTIDQIPPRTPRQPLSPSPYHRRVSHGTTPVRTSVTRKLNMSAASPSLRRQSGSSSTARRIPLTSAARRASGPAFVPARRDSASANHTPVPIERRLVPDRVDLRRRQSGGKTGRAVSALESFRAARRASLEQSEDGDGARNGGEVGRNGGEGRGMRRGDGGEGVGSEEGKGVDGVQSSVASRLDEVLAEAEGVVNALPDRTDRFVQGKSVLSTPRRFGAKTGRRVSARFSDAEVCLDNVDRLRSSLGGRRRSCGVNEAGRLPDTPVLRRTSFGTSVVSSEVTREGEENGAGGKEGDRGKGDIDSAAFRNRNPLSPLRSISNEMFDANAGASAVVGKKRNASDFCSKRLSAVPVLDDDDISAWASEDVEDLGAF